MSEQKNQISKTTAQSAIAKYSGIYDTQIANMAKDCDLELSQSQKLSVTTGAQQIFSLCKSQGIDVKDLDQSNVAQVLFNLAMLNVNPNAVPHECYLMIRKNKSGPTIELGLEGDGNDALVRKYGVGVKSLSSPFVVREGDEFTYPYFDGEKMCPPTWKIKSLSAKPILVFYTLVKTDGTVEYLMADRESVAVNLRAHIANNMMSVTKKSKEEIINKIENMTLDQMLKDTSLRTAKLTISKYDTTTRKYITEEVDVNLISPAYTGPAREEMIIRKMRNNCLKKYPKSFDTAFLSKAYESTFEDNVVTHTDAQEIVDVEYNEKNNTEENKSVLVNETISSDDNGVVYEVQQESVAEPQKVEEDKLPDWAR